MKSPATRVGMSALGQERSFSQCPLRANFFCFELRRNNREPLNFVYVAGDAGAWAVWSVPEPGTLFLFGAGLLGLGALHRRRAVKLARS